VRGSCAVCDKSRKKEGDREREGERQRQKKYCYDKRNKHSIVGICGNPRPQVSTALRRTKSQAKPSQAIQNKGTTALQSATSTNPCLGLCVPIERRSVARGRVCVVCSRCVHQRPFYPTLKRRHNGRRTADGRTADGGRSKSVISESSLTKEGRKEGTNEAAKKQSNEQTKEQTNEPSNDERRR